MGSELPLFSQSHLPLRCRIVIPITRSSRRQKCPFRVSSDASLAQLGRHFWISTASPHTPQLDCSSSPIVPSQPAWVLTSKVLTLAGKRRETLAAHSAREGDGSRDLLQPETPFPGRDGVSPSLGSRCPGPTGGRVFGAQLEIVFKDQKEIAASSLPSPRRISPAGEMTAGQIPSEGAEGARQGPPSLPPPGGSSNPTPSRAAGGK